MNKAIVLLLHISSKEENKTLIDAESMLGSCNVQVLLATNFNVVPYDQTTWNDLRGAARTILRQCIRGHGFGGLVTRNGTLLPSTIHSKRGDLQ